MQSDRRRNSGHATTGIDAANASEVRPRAAVSPRGAVWRPVFIFRYRRRCRDGGALVLDWIILRRSCHWRLQRDACFAASVRGDMTIQIVNLPAECRVRAHQPKIMRQRPRSRSTSFSIFLTRVWNRRVLSVHSAEASRRAIVSLHVSVNLAPIVSIVQAHRSEGAVGNAALRTRYSAMSWIPTSRQRAPDRHPEHW